MNNRRNALSRRQMLEMTAGLSGFALTIGGGLVFARETKQTPTRRVTIDAKTEPITIDIEKTAVIVVDMQNDFASVGGMFQRAGRDLSLIQAAIAPTARVLDAARREGIKIIYFKMAFKPDLSDVGSPDSMNRRIHLKLGAGQTVRAPNGTQSRILVRDTWNSDILTELTPKGGDIVLYKTRFGAFYETKLESILKQVGVKYLILTGCATSTCVESTVREAMFRDYLPIVLADCTGDLNKNFHESALSRIERLFGWISNSDQFIKGIETPPAAATSKS